MCRMSEFVVREAIVPELAETTKEGVIREMVRSRVRADTRRPRARRAERG